MSSDQAAGGSSSWLPRLVGALDSSRWLLSFVEVACVGREQQQDIAYEGMLASSKKQL